MVPAAKSRVQAMSAPVTTPLGMVDTGTPPSLLASNALPIGTRVNEFEIMRVIGEGGFSVVYLAFDHTLHRSIALKEYIPSALASRRGDNTVAVRSAQHQQTFEAGLRSFINEARLLAQFDHPALVKVYRFWEGNGTAYMAMPHYDGRTLKAILRENPEQASEAWLKQLLVPLLDALELLHRHRCFHRDIAPDNIQILENEAPVLLDFGAARRTIGDMTQAFTVILKPGYAPIEQYADETDLKQGPWTDVYALAAVLFGAIAQKPPPTAVARVIKDPLEPLANRSLPGYSHAFLCGIDRGLGVRPEERPQSIAEWRQMLGVHGAPHRATEHPPPAADVTAIAVDALAATPPVISAAARSSSASGGRDSDARITESSAEKERTVLVPGLWRSRRAHARVDPGQAERAIARDGVNVRSALLRPLALIAIATVIAAVVAVVYLRTPEVTRVTQTEPSTNPTQTNSKTAEGPLPSGKTDASETGRVALPPISPQEPSKKENANESQAARTDATSPPATPPKSVDAPTMRPAPAPKGSPTDPAQPLPEDQRRWAAIKDSNLLEDFYAFQLQFPESRHARDVAARIKEIERRLAKAPAPAEPSPGKTPPKVAEPRPQASAEQLPGKTSPKVAEPKAPAPAESLPGKAPPSVAEQQNRPRVESPVPPPAINGQKAVVRVRVAPFGYVYVDGALVGPSPPRQEVQVGPGRHRIEARNPEARPSIVYKEVEVTGTAPTDVQLRFDE